MHDLIAEFLNAYAAHRKWAERDSEKLLRKLCEGYIYSPRTVHGREFLMIALGWMWGKSQDYIAANAQCVMLEFRLNEVYSVVAKENDW